MLTSESDDNADSSGRMSLFAIMTTFPILYILKVSITVDHLHIILPGHHSFCRYLINIG